MTKTRSLHTCTLDFYKQHALRQSDFFDRQNCLFFLAYCSIILKHTLLHLIQDGADYLYIKRDSCCC